MQKFSRSLRLFSGIATCAILEGSTSIMMFAAGATPSDTSSSRQFIFGAGWRRTKYGWQDSTHWFVETYAPRPGLELIHPLVWAALILFTVIAVVIWASEEWEFARLFDANNSNDE